MLTTLELDYERTVFLCIVLFWLLVAATEINSGRFEAENEFIMRILDSSLNHQKKVTTRLINDTGRNNTPNLVKELVRWPLPLSLSSSCCSLCHQPAGGGPGSHNDSPCHCFLGNLVLLSCLCYKNECFLVYTSSYFRVWGTFYDGLDLMCAQ